MTAPTLMEVFGEGGLFAERFDGYSPRPGQIEMARAVELAIDDGQHLLVEGPTGTGKSLAYLVPTILDAVRDDRRVLVVTANIALQEQLVTKDLPLLAELLPVGFSFALMKGRSNYLCRWLFDHEEEEGTLEAVFEPDQAGQLEELVDWARVTSRGDVSELPFKPVPSLWRRFSMNGDDCPGSDCPLYERCYHTQAAARAAASTVVVANYHLLFAHLVVRHATGEDIVLPTFDVVVLDEAHKAAEIARDFFGFRVSYSGLRRLTAPLEKLSYSGLPAMLRQTALAFCDDLGRLFRSRNYRVRLRRSGAVRYDDLVGLLGEAAEIYAAAAKTEDKAEARRLRRLAERCNETAERIGVALSLADPNAVTFLDEDHHRRGVLGSKPIQVNHRLRYLLFDQVHCAVVTSATLSTDQSFELARASLGVPEPRELVVESPFEFAEQALMVVPRDLPDPTDPAWPSSVASHVLEAIQQAGGRTLGLFTSYKNLNLAHHRVLGCDHGVLRQGDQARTALIKAFREDVGSVLLGTESFWAGVDVPGESLSCVVIDRLPFPSPEDPVLDAIREHDSRWFMHHGLPRAVLAFKQGFGRLIRSAGDRGVVVVLDPRILTRPYGRLFLRSLPRVPISRDLADIGRFLEPPTPPRGQS